MVRTVLLVHVRIEAHLRLAKTNVRFGPFHTPLHETVSSLKRAWMRLLFAESRITKRCTRLRNKSVLRSPKRAHRLDIARAEEPVLLHMQPLLPGHYRVDDRVVVPFT